MVRTDCCPGSDAPEPKERIWPPTIRTCSWRPLGSNIGCVWRTVWKPCLNVPWNLEMDQIWTYGWRSNFAALFLWRPQFHPVFWPISRHADIVGHWFLHSYDQFGSTVDRRRESANQRWENRWEKVGPIFRENLESRGSFGNLVIHFFFKA